jgi:hypothetical protein
MTPNQLTSAARNLAYGLGISVYVRDGRIYQNGPGLAFLPPNGDPAVAEVPLDQKEEADAANGPLTVPKAIGLLLMANTDPVVRLPGANVPSVTSARR